MKRALRKLVFVEPRSTHLHIYSRVCIPRLGSVLLGTIMRAKGYDVRVYIEDIQAIDMNEVLSADLVAVSAITSTAPQSYKLADMVRKAGRGRGHGRHAHELHARGGAAARGLRGAR